MKNEKDLERQLEEIENEPVYPGKFKELAKKKAELQAYRRDNKTKKATVGGQRLHTRMRQVQALELRQAGFTWSAIAQELGYSNESSARKAVFGALREASQTPAEQIIMLEDIRLDRLFLANWPDAINPQTNPEIRRKAAEICLKIMERRSKLHGLDRPTAQTTAEQQQGQELHSAKTRLMDRLTIMFEHESETTRQQDPVDVIDGSFKNVLPADLGDDSEYDPEVDEYDC